MSETAWTLPDEGCLILDLTCEIPSDTIAKLPCGCLLQVRFLLTGGPGTEAHVHYCPMHAAAPDLLAAAERIVEAVWGENRSQSNLAAAEHDLRAAIAKAGR